MKCTRVSSAGIHFMSMCMYCHCTCSEKFTSMQLAEEALRAVVDQNTEIVEVPVAESPKGKGKPAAPAK